MKRFLVFLGILAITAGLFSLKKSSIYYQQLSDYAVFEGQINQLNPKEELLPYALNSTLFSDYAQKARFIFIPKGSKIAYQNNQVLELPVGTLIFKNFFYYLDEKKPEIGRRLIETRVLKREEAGWVTLPYIWNEEQTDAILDVAGKTIPVKFKNTKGKTLSFDYEVPNKNQCKGCHELDGKIMPIGPSARQLNGDFTYQTGKENQLVHWEKLGFLEGLPKNLALEDHLINYQDESQSLDDRARGYLDVNCGHCHNPQGPAKNSGLFLNWKNFKTHAYGLMKPPVAAGKGSGNLQFDIVAGKPEESILYYRMNSIDPGVMMPELGRKLKHEEGIKLIKDWISQL